MPNLISILIVLPLVGALVLAFVPRGNDNATRWIALLTVLVEFGLSVVLFLGFRSTADVQFVERVGMDSAARDFVLRWRRWALSLLLVLLTTFLMVIAIGGSWAGITDRVKEYHIVFLVLEAAIIGVFVSLDLFLFYVFWEFTLIPMALLIGIWGHGRRIYAAIKFILFTMFGSTLMLVAILVLVFNHRDVDRRADVRAAGNLEDAGAARIAGHPVRSLRAGLCDQSAHVPVPHLAARRARRGADRRQRDPRGRALEDGDLRLYSLQSAALSRKPPTTSRRCSSCLRSSASSTARLSPIVQRDIKSLVAFSSVSHLGFVMLGLFAFNAQGMSGGILQMVNHGLSTGALFLLVGMLYERRHTRLIADFGGVAKVMPIYAAFFLLVMFSSVGLPGLNGFVGEFLILVGAFQANVWYAVFAATGVVLSAIYLLWMYQRVMTGEVNKPENAALKDLNVREIALMVALVVLIVWIGVYPRTFLDPIQASVANLLSVVK